MNQRVNDLREDINKQEMSVLVVGSVALDTIETPYGKVTDALGGSAIYFSAAASLFAPVRMVGVVGEDFDLGQLRFLEERGVDIQGLEVKRGKTFRWWGRYHQDLNVRESLDTQLNVFQDFKPAIPEVYRDSQYVFLANIDPGLQLDILEQITKPRLVAMDTMNYWIKNKPSQLRSTIRAADVLIVNDSEARELAREPNLIRASKKINEMGPEVVIIKKGEHGAVMISKEGYFSAPAYPLEEIQDPTGAGDTFAGGFLGYLARRGDISEAGLRKAIVHGSVLASFCVEGFGLDRLKEVTLKEVEERYLEFRKIMKF